MIIPKDIQKEWDEHLYNWRTMVGFSKFLLHTVDSMFDFSSTLSDYALNIALEKQKAVKLPYLYSYFINVYMFSGYVLDDYLWCEERKEVFLKYLRSELDESKEQLQRIIEDNTVNYGDR